MGGPELFTLVKDIWGLGAAALVFFWFVLAVLLFLGGKHEKDKHRLLVWAGQMHLPYHATMQRLMRGLARWLLPDTVENTPKPTTGFFDRFEWGLIPRSRDAADLRRLVNNPWSWPVLSAAMLLAVLYPIL